MHENLRRVEELIKLVLCNELILYSFGSRIRSIMSLIELFNSATIFLEWMIEVGDRYTIGIGYSSLLLNFITVEDCYHINTDIAVINLN